MKKTTILVIIFKSVGEEPLCRIRYPAVLGDKAGNRVASFRVIVGPGPPILQSISRKPVTRLYKTDNTLHITPEVGFCEMLGSSQADVDNEETALNCAIELPVAPRMLQNNQL